MNKQEKDLLLFFEDCEVNHAGLVDTRRMNDEDREIAEKWNASGFVQFGRIALSDVAASRHYKENNLTHWCILRKDAWEEAANQRRTRAFRNRNKRVDRLRFIGGEQAEVIE